MNEVIKQEGAEFDIKPYDYAKAIGLISCGIIPAEDLALLHIDCLSDLICVAQTSGAKYAHSVLEDVRQSVSKAIEIELPTEAELAHYDREAEKIAEQFHQHDFRASPKAVTKQWRINLFINGKDVDGLWQAWNERQYQKTTTFCAAYGIGYSVEFK